MLLLNTPKATSPVRKTNLSESLVDYLKQQILQGKLNPGDRIVETKIAEDLSVSQTPVREALRQLSGEGIVVLVPNKGPVVRSLDMQDVFEIYSVRAGLEGMSMRFATQRASDEEVAQLQRYFGEMEEKLHDASVPETGLLEYSATIHQYVVDLSRHSRLISMYQSISFQISLVNRILGKESSKQKEVDQHREVVEALAGRNPGLAENVMRRHIYRSYCEFVAVQQNPVAEALSYQWFE